MQKRLIHLQSRLDQVSRAWTAGDHETLMRFFVQILPDLMNAERCSIFVSSSADTASGIWLRFGTGVADSQIEAPRQGSVVGEAVSSNRMIIRNDLKSTTGFHTVADRATQFITRNILCVPITSLVHPEECIGAIEILNRNTQQGFTEQDGAMLENLVKYLSFALESSRLNRDILELSERVHNDIELFRLERFDRVKLITKSQKMRDLLNLVHKVAAVPVNVCITGESGTGKEVIAQIIHQSSERRQGPFVAVNCSSIPEHLMESEFFGHERGAFTNAFSSRIGRFDEASEGTLFLDEVADMPLSIQPKFLRAIQEREGCRIGSNKVHKYDFRLISASYRNLREEVEAGRFREDLFFRLFAVEIVVPPLRERSEDIIPLAQMFMTDTMQRFRKKVAGFTVETLELFEQFPWPGNVRQLQHEIERLVALTPEGDYLRVEHCSRKLLSMRDQEVEAGQRIVPSQHQADGPGTAPILPLEEVRRLAETEAIVNALRYTQGNRIKTAELMGITRQSLHNKMRRYGLFSSGEPEVEGQVEE
ncbi:MAG: sigma-54-dependent Fis family transcriptional regulator [Magnetococcales bacterium]|nr:sigma-54-dependent Fis family transcriptional regulator [Magnetococcales bacterium]